jgi:TRAP-type mannitol/chloroaromatic compound transport system permease small subunit
MMILGIIGAIIGIICLVLAAIAFIPLLGWLYWLIIPIAIIGLIFGILSRNNGGLAAIILCSAVIVIGIVRLALGGGIL